MKFFADVSGQAMTEYILIVFLIALGCVQMLKMFGVVLDIALLQSARKLGAFGSTIK